MARAREGGLERGRGGSERIDVCCCRSLIVTANYDRGFSDEKFMTLLERARMYPRTSAQATDNDGRYKSPSGRIGSEAICGMVPVIRPSSPRASRTGHSYVWRA